MSQELQEKFYERSYYTVTYPDPASIHQHIVDAFRGTYTIPDFESCAF
jgi:hypothetical protein